MKLIRLTSELNGSESIWGTTWKIFNNGHRLVHDASLNEVIGLLSAQLLGKYSHPEGIAKLLHVDKLPGEYPYP